MQSQIKKYRNRNKEKKDNHKNGIDFLHNVTREYGGHRKKLKKLPGISNFSKKL